eukprot:1150619-Pelagomonas_calceolata.AAC.2
MVGHHPVSVSPHMQRFNVENRRLRWGSSAQSLSRVPTTGDSSWIAQSERGNSTSALIQNCRYSSTHYCSSACFIQLSPNQIKLNLA